MADSHRRTIAKGITWRAIATTITFSLIYIATGDLAISATLGGVDIIVKFLAYYGHERYWNRVQWGLD